MCHKEPKPRREEKDDALLLHGNLAEIDQKEHSGHAYATNALTQYDLPTGRGYREESDQAVEDAKNRVDQNHL